MYIFKQNDETCPVFEYDLSFFKGKQLPQIFVQWLIADSNDGHCSESWSGCNVKVDIIQLLKVWELMVSKYKYIYIYILFLLHTTSPIICFQI